MYRTRYVDEWVNIGQAVAAVNLPERGEMPAASFPDVHLVATEPNVELRNVQWWCEARGDQRCAFVENLSIRRLGPAEYLATGTHRSRATRAGLQGDKYQKQSHAVIDTVPAQALVYGQTFVVEAPNDDSPVTLIGHLSRSGVFVLNPRTFQTDSRFRRTDDAVVGNLHYYTFECLVPQ